MQGVITTQLEYNTNNNTYLYYFHTLTASSMAAVCKPFLSFGICKNFEIGFIISSRVLK